MFVAANNPDNQRAIELTKQARTAELEGNLQDAYDLYGQASALLVKAIANCEKKTEERRRAKLCLRATTDRQKALRACIEGEGSSPEPLPSLATLSKEMETLPETIPLSLVCWIHRVVLRDSDFWLSSVRSRWDSWLTFRRRS